jgi:hypothetical protein
LYSDFTTELAKGIEAGSPKLSLLHISGDLYSDWVLSLPSHHLKKIYISTWCSGEINGFSIKTTCDDKLQFYALQGAVSYRRGKLETKDQVLPISKNGLKKRLMLDVTCASVEDMTFVIN